MEEEQFLKYVEIQESGVTNMFNVTAVIALSDGLLTKEDCIDIMRNYSLYKERWSE